MPTVRFEKATTNQQHHFYRHNETVTIDVKARLYKDIEGSTRTVVHRQVIGHLKTDGAIMLAVFGSEVDRRTQRFSLAEKTSPKASPLTFSISQSARFANSKPQRFSQNKPVCFAIQKPHCPQTKYYLVSFKYSFA